MCLRTVASTQRTTVRAAYSVDYMHDSTLALRLQSDLRVRGVRMPSGKFPWIQRIPHVALLAPTVSRECVFGSGWHLDCPQRWRLAAGRGQKGNLEDDT